MHDNELRSAVERLHENYRMYTTRNFTTWNAPNFDIGTLNRPSDDNNHVLTAMKEVKEAAQPVVAIDETKVATHASLLKELGFDSLHKTIEGIADRSMKENLAALSGYKKIPYAKFEAADHKLRSNTMANKTLALTEVSKYIGQHYTEGDRISDEAISLPPTDVLEKMAVARKADVFDGFSIIHVVRGPDPILVGTIKGTRDMFMIAEWGDDISFKEIVS